MKLLFSIIFILTLWLSRVEASEIKLSESWKKLEYFLNLRLM